MSPEAENQAEILHFFPDLLLTQFCVSSIHIPSSVRKGIKLIDIVVPDAQITTSTSHSSPKLTISLDWNMHLPFRSCPTTVCGWRLQDYYLKGDSSSLKNINFNLDRFCQTDSLYRGNCPCWVQIRPNFGLFLHCQLGSFFQNSWYNLKNKRTNCQPNTSPPL